MAANPALVRTHPSELVPAPYPGEFIVLKRAGMLLELDAVQTPTGKWSSRGSMFLSNVRLVFLAEKSDPSGLTGFDLPLVYLQDDKLVQPIFGCNHLKGKVWPAAPGGGPAGSLPPHEFKLYFKEGGIGTFYPLFYQLASQAKSAMSRAHSAHQRGPVSPPPSSYVEGLLAKAFVDPADPSTLYLSQPVDESQRLTQAPKYAANYGEDETYEALEPPRAPAAPAAPGNVYPAIPPQQ